MLNDYDSRFKKPLKMQKASVSLSKKYVRPHATFASKRVLPGRPPKSIGVCGGLRGKGE
jgi:hypothetical protein